MGLQDVIQAELGQLYTAGDVAMAFAKPRNWVYKNAVALGGRKVGGEWQFFEKNIVQALKTTSMGGCFAGQTDKQEDGKSRGVRSGYTAERSTKRKEVPFQEKSVGMGSFSETEIARVLEADPCGLLA